jgi:hypothetical protein
MKFRAIRDTLDYTGKQQSEIAEIDISIDNFNPTDIVKDVVISGDFDIQKLPDISYRDKQDINDQILNSFTKKGNKYNRYSVYKTIKKIASEFIPLGFQYVIYNDKNKNVFQKWVQTNKDIIKI